MPKTRKGVFTPKQEQKLDELIKLKGIAEALDGPAIRMADNRGIELLKSKIPPEYIPVVYEIVDEIMSALGAEK